MLRYPSSSPDLPPDDPRYEIKRVTPMTTLPWVRSWIRLHGGGFREAYPARKINSVYLDSPFLRNFAQNRAGASDRNKLRFRWYGEDFRRVKGTLEVKCRRNLLGWKIRAPIETEFDFERDPWSRIMGAIRREIPQDLVPALDLTSEPTLINRYWREYFVSFDGALRVTLDYDQSYYDQRGTHIPNLRLPVLRWGQMVIECKADARDSDRVRELIAELPLRVSRCSKYVHGVEAILGFKADPF